MSKYTLLFYIFNIGLIASLIMLAIKGNTAAIIILSIIITLAVLALGASIVLAGYHLATLREQRNFAANASENLQIIKAIQNVQGAQNSQLSQQLKQLPEPEPQFSLEIDEGIFTMLEDSEGGQE